MAIITDADLKAHLGITGAQHDTVVTNSVNAANQAVVQYLGRDPSEMVVVGLETARVFRPTTPRLAFVSDFHDVTNLVVATDDDDDGVYETTWATSDFVLEPLNQLENGVTVPYYRIVAVESQLLPESPRPSLQVTAAWGWASVPAVVFDAAILKAARLFHRKDSPQGVAGFTEFGAVRVTQHDTDVKVLLDPFRRPESAIPVA